MFLMSFACYDRPSEAYQVLYVASTLTFKNSTRYPHCVCFVRLSEQATTYALHDINRMVLYKRGGEGFYAVRTESFYKGEELLL